MTTSIMRIPRAFAELYLKNACGQKYKNNHNNWGVNNKDSSKLITLIEHCISYSLVCRFHKAAQRPKENRLNKRDCYFSNSPDIRSQGLFGWFCVFWLCPGLLLSWHAVSSACSFHLMDQHGCFSSQVGREREGALLSRPWTGSCSHPIGQKLVMWPHLAARKPGKCNL